MTVSPGCCALPLGVADASRHIPPRPPPSPVVTGSREGLRETSVSPPLTGVSSRMSLICGPAPASPCADSRVCRSLRGHHLRARFCTSLSGDVPGPVQLVPMPQRQEAWGGGAASRGTWPSNVPRGALRLSLPSHAPEQADAGRSPTPTPNHLIRSPPNSSCPSRPRLWPPGPDFLSSHTHSSHTRQLVLCTLHLRGPSFPW